MQIHTAESFKLVEFSSEKRKKQTKEEIFDNGKYVHDVFKRNNKSILNLTLVPIDIEQSIQNKKY